MRLRQRALGALALLGLVGILTGLPMLLLALGNPLPSEVPTWDQLRVALLSPDDGTLALGVLKALGWVLGCAGFQRPDRSPGSTTRAPSTHPAWSRPAASDRPRACQRCPGGVCPRAQHHPRATRGRRTRGGDGVIDAGRRRNTGPNHPRHCPGTWRRVTHAGRRCRAGPRRPGPVGQVHRAAGGHPLVDRATTPRIG